MENVYLKTKNKSKCNGCTACMYVCPKQCITMQEDNEGFIYPVIDESKCANCGKCLKVCSNHEKEKDRDITPFAMINNSKKILMKSTSGGAFYSILEKIFKKDHAVCYGAAYTEDMVVKHKRAISLKEAMDFLGSKYVRSDITGIYDKVKQDLNEDKFVLFTATPCETAGLYTYLNKDYDNLLTVDIICHSNPSPKVFKKYIDCLKLKYNSNIKKYTFRAKENGWSNPVPIVEFTNGTKIEETTFQKAFSRCLISRPSCSDCKFLKPYNYADITIGDFWGVEKLTQIEKTEEGISLVFANTAKGLEIINSLENAKVYELEKNVDYFKYNHNKVEKPHRNRTKFFNKLEDCKTEKIINLISNMSKERLGRRVLKKLKIIK